jgi:hypothetical protein
MPPRGGRGAEEAAQGRGTANMIDRRGPTQREIMHDLLGRLGTNQISLEEFWRRLKQTGLTEADIDLYLEGTL